MDYVTNLMKHFSLKGVVDMGAILIKEENMWVVVEAFDQEGDPILIETKLVVM
jgi:hypothetical protein